MNISNVAANCDGKIKRVEPEIVSLQTTGSSLRALLRVYKPMEGTVKARLRSVFTRTIEELDACFIVIAKALAK